MKDFGISNWRGKQVFALATEKNIKAMTKAAILVERSAKINMTVPGSGHTRDGVWIPGLGVKRTKTGKRHYAAKPGQPPAVDMGILKSAIFSQVNVEGLNVVGKVGPDIDAIKEGLQKLGKRSVGTDLEYGLYLELGTSKMAARPFLRPALKRTAKKVLQIFKKANR